MKTIRIPADPTPKGNAVRRAARVAKIAANAQTLTKAGLKVEKGVNLVISLP